MKLIYLEQEHPCSCAEKDTAQGIVRAYGADGTLLLQISNLRDFSLVRLEDGEWSEPPVPVEARLNEVEDLIAMLLFGGEAV